MVRGLEIRTSRRWINDRGGRVCVPFARVYARFARAKETIKWQPFPSSLRNAGSIAAMWFLIRRARRSAPQCKVSVTSFPPSLSAIGSRESSRMHSTPTSSVGS
ncbi:hypothetical protein MESS4_720097 [Mesorhizobium sp. STM 4661]|nr:hypothetical protein MESS4_720097 [Mesorhizobium sp. STM 4661]